MILLVVLAGCDATPEPEGADDPVGTEAGPEERDPMAASLPVEVSLEIADLSPPPAADDGALTADVEAARAVLRDYYAAINASDYDRAYARWGDGGRSSGQTYLEFVAGFGATAAVSVELGEAGRVEGAAGSRYVRIPVVVQARRDDGRRQRFEGSYTLRRSVVDGASPAQRSWHLYDAELRQVQ